MKKNNFAARGALIGLTALLANSTSCLKPQTAVFDSAQISNNNPFSGRTQEICEGDLQKEPLFFEYPVFVLGREDIPLGFVAEIVQDKEGKKSPIAVDYSWNKVKEREWRAKIMISDFPDEEMNWGWTNGSTWTVGIKVYDERLGQDFGLFRLVNGYSSIDNFTNYTDHIHYTVLKGLCNEELTERLQNLTDRLENLELKFEQHINVENKAQNYIIGDGKCDIALGEPSDSIDCVSKDDTPPYIIGDGKCDIALGEPSDSIDCVSKDDTPPYIIGDGKCDIALGEPSDSIDCVSKDDTPPYIIGDGKCDIALGEPSDSIDCVSKDDTPPYIIGDGKCDIALGEPSDSIDCVSKDGGGNGELEKLVGWACSNLNRGEKFGGKDIRFYKVRVEGGNFVSEENFELEPGNEEYNIVHHIIPAGEKETYWVAVAGNSKDLGKIVKFYSGVAKAKEYNPEVCKHILILNSEKEVLIPQYFSTVLESESYPTLEEIVRVKVVK